MKPVDQSILLERDGNGDCWAACLASLLEVSIDQVPKALSDPAGGSSSQIWETQTWLALGGKDIVWRDFTNPERPRMPVDVLGFLVILVGPSPRNRFEHHAVVGVIEDVEAKRWTVVHDPHPSRAGILSLSQAWWIVRPVLLERPLTPAAARVPSGPAA